MSELQILVTADAQLPLANGALAAADREDRVVVQRGLRAPQRSVAIVFAEDLDAYLAALPDARLAERTLVANPPWSDVFELLEKHRLGGAFACAEPASWSMMGHLIAHRATFRREEGETMSGPGRESEHYICWKDGQYLSLFALVKSYAERCLRHSQRDEELAITPDQAGRRGLPAIGLRLTIGVDFMPTLFPAPGAYVSLHGWRDHGVLLSIEDDSTGASLLEVARRKHALDKVPPLCGELDEIVLAGAPRAAIACVSGDIGKTSSAARCYVHVPHRAGRLLVTAGYDRVASVNVSTRDVLAHSTLPRIVETLQLV